MTLVTLWSYFFFSPIEPQNKQIASAAYNNSCPEAFMLSGATAGIEAYSKHYQN